MKWQLKLQLSDVTWMKFCWQFIVFCFVFCVLSWARDNFKASWQRQSDNRKKLQWHEQSIENIIISRCQNRVVTTYSYMATRQQLLTLKHCHLVATAVWCLVKKKFALVTFSLIKINWIHYRVTFNRLFLEPTQYNETVILWSYKFS